jgi:D-threo-aldose 1-dehydrogenase
MQFDTRRLGRTSLNVTTMGLGCATLGGNLETVTDSAARLLVIDAYDSGIRYFDTAPFYGYGKSEHMVGDELRNRDGWILSTKVGRVLRPRRAPHGQGQWPLDYRRQRRRLGGRQGSVEQALQIPAHAIAIRPLRP